MPSLRLPQIQNFACHNCGNCCQHYTVFITDAEHDRILKQNWSPDRGAPAGEAAFARHGGRWRLAKRDDGRCVFYDLEHKRCRIHAEYGGPAKPLACRIYPFAFAPAGRSMAVSLRFSCPTVAANVGPPVADLHAEIDPLARAAGDVSDLPPPRISPMQQLDWPDTLRLVDALEAMLRDGQTDDEGTLLSLPMQLIRARFVVSMLGQADFAKVRGGRIGELVETLADAAPMEVPPTLDTVPVPTRVALLQFRSLVMHFARLDSLAADETSLRGRLGMVLAGVKFARGRGRTPRMQERLPPVPFADLDLPHAPPDDALRELFGRYLRTNVRALHFGGTALHGLPLTVGFDDLAMMVPIACYLARWRARAAGRSQTTAQDLRDALMIADRHYGGSPVMASTHFAARMRMLASQGQIDPLIVSMAR